MLASTIAVLLDAIKLILSYNGVMINSVLNNWLLTTIFFIENINQYNQLSREKKQASTYIRTIYAMLWRSVASPLLALI
jgi:hypothetical protein